MKRLAALVLALAVLALSAPAARASSASALFNRGNELYKAGSFSEAAKAYRDALQTGRQDPDLYYNLGNAELRAGRLGPAVAAYLHAQRLAPRDADIRFNLAYARVKVAGKTAAPNDAFTRAFESIIGMFSANEALAALAVLYWLAAASVAGLILGRDDRLRRVCRSALIFSAVLALLFAPLAGVRIRRDLVVERGVILSAQPARSGPGENNARQFDLPEGREVEIGECRSGWCQVTAPGGFVGWVEAKGFERL